ncbi:hypothetical protein QF205_02010 [Luteimonas composti]|uniref:Uncharacterized protein n=1 Tax=Luteimonas composti TaxID=398257 RepID=A0ABT6MMQ6_9GAMM|nr:hypothetical protein [Luteimonas composti]MDH7451853.1 hypothetical protein [Luteimonas composti]
MATPNTALEALLGQFAAGPLSGPDEERQLRAALSADPDRMALLNGMAASGQLRGFAIETSNATLVGTYDRQAGMIHLPAASFRDGDLEPVAGLQVLVADFSRRSWRDSNGQSHSITQDMVDNLNATFNGSPVLAAQVKAAVALSHVQHLSLLDNGMAAGATYDGTVGDGTPKGINLPPVALQRWSPGTPQGTYDAQDLTFVLGHEIQHGFNDAEKDKATLDFLRDIAIQAKAPGPVHDYSDELRAYLGAGRDDEAKAQIAGWNALLSRQRQFNPHADGIGLMLNTQNDRLLDFVRADPLNPSQAVVNSGITFNPDGSLSPTPANVAAMGKHYFDRPSPLHAQPGERPVTLGEGRPGPSADYTNYYGTWAVERIIAAEDRADVRHRGARPQIAIDMAGLGLREDLIEMEGLDLGTNRAPRPYLDTSRSPAATGHFHHTQDASMGHDHQHVPVADLPRIMRSGDAVVDAWIEALQDGDHAAARAVQRAFADSIEGRGMWAEATGTAVRNTGQGHGPAPSPERALPASDGRWPDAVPSIPFPSGPHELAELQQAMQR